MKLDALFEVNWLSCSNMQQGGIWPLFHMLMDHTGVLTNTTEYFFCCLLDSVDWTL